MPHEAVRIFMEAEDRRFYSHHGIDTGAVFRAFVQNVQERRTVSGASTITMQLARIIRPARSRNIAVKIRESFDALRLESRCPKDRILELYLNNVPFGFNSEGRRHCVPYVFRHNARSADGGPAVLPCSHSAPPASV
jgi:penicillin-binding protein 1C